jgi:hypothetical protein
MNFWHEHQEKWLQFKTVKQSAGRNMTVTKPFNPTQSPSTRDAERGMTFEIPFNHIRTHVGKQQHKPKKIYISKKKKYQHQKRKWQGSGGSEGSGNGERRG